MTRDDIIRMAREAGSIDSEDVIETVWAAFTAAEREECAKVCKQKARKTQERFKEWWVNNLDGCPDYQKFVAQDAWEAAVAAEREKSLRLWMLLDDVDTADDIAKSDNAVYRSLCRQAHQKRWAVMTGDEVDATIRARGEK